jgi:preprotein translocase subunit SecF
MSRLSRMGHALYEGQVSIDFVGRKWLWYALSGVIVLAAVSGLLVRGLNLGIEFKGGVEYQVSMPAGQNTEANVVKIRQAVARTAGTANIPAADAPIVNTSGNSIRVQTEPLNNDESTTISRSIQKAVGVGNNAISSDAIGATWGKQVAERALLGLLVFLVLVVLFIWAYFREWKMSVAALVALAHDLVITVGIYALAGFEITPASVIGFLTILGYSLYDTVVVFDKVRENTSRLTADSPRTFAETVNLAVNQTLVRSINTSIVALLPIAGILFIGAALLGAGTLRDISLALFIGIIVGTYSTIFLATPLYSDFRSTEPAIKLGTRRALAARARA